MWLPNPRMNIAQKTTEQLPPGTAKAHPESFGPAVSATGRGPCAKGTSCEISRRCGWSAPAPAHCVASGCWRRFAALPAPWSRTQLWSMGCLRRWWARATLNVVDKAFASAQTTSFEADLALSHQVTYAEWQDRPLRERFGEWIASLIGTQL